MKAPDKICVAPHQVFDNDLEIQEVGHNGAEEYIRKEALLEWLKDNVPIEVSVYGFMGGYMAAYKQVIDKLNSM